MRTLLSAIAVSLLVASCGQQRPDVTMHPADAPPPALSEWGVVFADSKRFEINERALPYSLNTPLFSDYALKLRTVWLPDGAAAAYRADGPMEFPVGTIVSKTFHYQKAGGFDAGNYRVVRIDRESSLNEQGQLSLETYVLVETRLLVRYEAGWKALPYVWNDAQDEAYLELAGKVVEMQLVDDGTSESFAYVVPDANQCTGCHTTDHSSKLLQLIGPTAWNLNRDFQYGQMHVNQLDHWQDIGVLSGVEEAPPVGVSWTRPGDASVGERSKAYLDVNCAHCHNRDGAADTSGLDLAIDTPVERSYGICKPPVAVGRGSGDRPYDIFPGRPDDSILIFRMENTDPAIAMPELGRGTVHQEAVVLLREWIATLPGDC